MRRPILERLLTRVEISSDGCWVWPGAHTSTGYGQIKVDGRMALAHRVAYEMLVGSVPTGLVLDHICRVRACCNPDHLEPVTQAENVRRGELAAINTSKTHCPAGHPYDDTNTYVFSPKRYRGCRACRLEASRRHRARKAVMS